MNNNSYSPYFIADIAANHDGSLERAHQLIELAANAGANAVKFQNFFANTIINPQRFQDLDNSVQTHQSNWKKSVYDVYDDASVPLAWTKSLYEKAIEHGVDYLTTPYDISTIEILEKYVSFWKVGSGDIDWLDLHNKLIDTGNKRIAVATGASSFADVEQLINHYQSRSALDRLILMQCNTNYTGSLENFKHINLNVINTFSAKWPNISLGLSDHTPGHSTVLGAIAYGALIIEKHFTDDNDREGPDHGFSMNPESWREMVERSEELSLALGNGQKVIEKNEENSFVVQRRGIYYKYNQECGHILKKDDFIALRPRAKNSLSPWELPELIGKTLSRNVSKNDVVCKDDFQ